MNIQTGICFLAFEVIWKDADILELQIKASNGRYMGTVEIYDTYESLINFEKSLTGYCIGSNTYYRSEPYNQKSKCTMKFRAPDNAGLVGVEVILEENTLFNDEDKPNNTVSLQLIAELNAIDNFAIELGKLIYGREGIAILQAIR
ncbi:hypothetical protein FMM05_17305 [Flavobacterium zepuense]|uniref:Uncharacterized protein n=1 Tax=Flavobacterium zepuense TaxID=2593302 RepID=A0A552UWP3_9FLAO|nr:hypothetical protein [Flavobacterium zepuense]TRW22636.1 hypothetical protein FMM05_17305 [Flavobacterium zepuense]